MSNARRAVREFHNDQADKLVLVEDLDVFPVQIETADGPVSTVAVKFAGRDDVFALPPGSPWARMFGLGIQMGAVVDMMNAGFSPPDVEDVSVVRVPCTGCGRALFGEVADAGVCASCAEVSS